MNGGSSSNDTVANASVIPAGNIGISVQIKGSTYFLCSAGNGFPIVYFCQ